MSIDLKKMADVHHAKKRIRTATDNSEDADVKGLLNTCLTTYGKKHDQKRFSAAILSVGRKILLRKKISLNYSIV